MMRAKLRVLDVLESDIALSFKLLINKDKMPGRSPVVCESFSLLNNLLFAHLCYPIRYPAELRAVMSLRGIC